MLERVVMDCEPDHMCIDIEAYYMAINVRRGSGKWADFSWPEVLLRRFCEQVKQKKTPDSVIVDGMGCRR